MKKIILSLLIVAASVSVASAQKSQWGVKAGFNASTYNIGIENATPSINLGCKPGFYIGGVYNFNFNDRNWGLQGELLYSMDGTRLALGKDLINEISGGDFNKTLSAGITAHNVRVPIMVKFQPIGRLSVMVGPYFSYRVATSLNFNSNTETLIKNELLTPSSDLTIDDIKNEGKDIINDNLRKFDVGATMGLEYKFCNGVFIDVRYSMSLLNSLTDKVKIDGEEATWNDLAGLDIQPKMNYSALQIGVGFRF